MSGPSGAAELHADVVIGGIGLGAVAAAMAVVRSGRTAVMAGPESRIGGQVTAQLTSPSTSTRGSRPPVAPRRTGSSGTGSVASTAAHPTPVGAG